MQGMEVAIALALGKGQCHGKKRNLPGARHRRRRRTHIRGRASNLTMAGPARNGGRTVTVPASTAQQLAAVENASWPCPSLAPPRHGTAPLRRGSEAARREGMGRTDGWPAGTIRQRKIRN